MNRFAFTLATLLVTLFIATPLMAQQKRLSPHETISSVIDDNRVMVVYGRPYTKNPRTGEVRKIWGELVPFGKVWRTGADEATLFITQQPLTIGGTTVPAGAYTLWTLPNEDGTAKLIINKQIGQWGVDPREPSNAYDEKQDLTRVDLKSDPLDQSVDQFTISIDKNPGGGGLLKLSWEKIQFSIPFTVQK
jgi:hypothetical protein